MSFLIAQILLLLVLAALFGGALVYWFMRRHFVDVSSEYERYERALGETRTVRQDKNAGDVRIAALEADKSQLDGRLADEIKWRKELEAKVETLSGAVAGIRPTDLAPVEARLEKIQGVVAKLENTDVSAIVAGVAATSAAVAAIKPTNLDPVGKRLEGIEGKVAATSAAVAALKPTDLAPVARKLDGIDGKVTTTSAAVAAMRPTNLEPVAKKLASIDSRVAALRNTDLSSVDTRVKTLSESVRQLEARLKPQPPADLSGVQKRLDGIEKVLKERPRPTRAPIAKKTSTPRATAPRKAAARKAAPKPKRKPAGALLKSASYGKADDLKQISGVGPKLEKMLHGIGVYYFFQVEAWTRSDVKRVDDLLKVFKGRIARDQWVKQARSLSKQPGAARIR